MEACRNEARAVAAACAVAADHGVAFEQAVVAHSGSNVLVHLRPAPVVARVMTGTAVLHDDPERSLSREVAVLKFLKPYGLAVRPSSAIAPGPYHRRGLWLTFWEWLGDHERASLDNGADAFGRALRDLHDADVSLSNLLVANGRLVFNDFEDTFRGPVHWDVASIVVSLRARGAHPAFVARALHAYGWADERGLAPFIEAHDVYG